MQAAGEAVQLPAPHGELPASFVGLDPCTTALGISCASHRAAREKPGAELNLWITAGQCPSHESTAAGVRWEQRGNPRDLVWSSRSCISW